MYSSSGIIGQMKMPGGAANTPGAANLVRRSAMNSILDSYLERNKVDSPSDLSLRQKRKLVRALYDAGMNQVEIADTIGCSQSTVSRDLKATGTSTGQTFDEPGYVYVFQLNEYYKIGLSTNVRVRWQVLNGTTPYDVDIVTTIRTDNMSKLEGELHQRFAKKRVNNKQEWFLLNSDDVTFLKQMAAKMHT